MPSMISFPIHSNAMGNTDAKRRSRSPMVTTSGPDCQTIFRTGGTCLRADKRSCHPLQKFSCSVIRVIRFEDPRLTLARLKRDSLEPTGFSRRAKCQIVANESPSLFALHVGFHS